MIGWQIIACNLLQSITVCANVCRALWDSRDQM